MDKTWLDIFLHNWPFAIFVPVVLMLLLTLALITRWWDARAEPRYGVQR